MSKKRGLSGDEKRNVILSIYHDQSEPFNLKEIETLASKKGVVLQTVIQLFLTAILLRVLTTDCNIFYTYLLKRSKSTIRV